MYADLALLITAAPDDEDVVAGPVGAAVFFGLVIVVALLMWNFTRQLKKVERAREAGVYGDPVASDDAAETEGDGDSGDSGDNGGSPGSDRGSSGSSSGGD